MTDFNFVDFYFSPLLQSQTIHMANTLSLNSLFSAKSELAFHHILYRSDFDQSANLFAFNYSDQVSRRIHIKYHYG